MTTCRILEPPPIDARLRSAMSAFRTLENAAESENIPQLRTMLQKLVDGIEVHVEAVPQVSQKGKVVRHRYVLCEASIYVTNL